MLIAAFAAIALQGPLVVDGVIVSPQWAATPPPEALIPVGTEWPARAEAELLCSVLSDGALWDCAVERSGPDGDERVTRHSLQLSQYFRLKPTLVNGQSVGGLKVRLRLRWES